ncbi:MAG: tripartite tricarboxylate transporter substrate binding protein [Betaproteobacteria bacterium]|nr:tripartite tricarboxylate transporter substrate binding protein [Betaproteobacteria bacterium]
MEARFVLTVAAGATAMLICLTGNAASQTYPTKPVRLVLPVTPGGGTDALARIIGPRLAEGLGQSIVIDNRGGAGGNIAIEIVAKAVPDGYTLYMGVGARLMVNPLTYKLAFDPIRDFAPITQLAAAQYILVVHPSVPAKAVNELIALAKARPGSLNYASVGVGSGPYLAAELFKSRTGIDIVQVPYKGGGPAATAVVGGEVQILFGSIASTLPHVKASKLRALAVTSKNRSHLIPELATIDESGLPGYNFTVWDGVLAPTGIPRTTVSRLHSEITKVLKMPDTRELFRRVGYEVTGTTPRELADILRAESAIWAKVIKGANIRAN